MPEERSDEALVVAARDGDDAAWGAIYDRYADRLHDYCHTILRDRHEAADAFHDAFVSATQHIGQLRDPSRLRPWLYAICRNESFRRAKRRERVRPTDEVDDVIAPEVEGDRSARQAELHEIVWAAADGLNPRDRSILDLNLRQGLEGQDLADALGVKVDHAYVMLSRLRDQVERALGALLVARLGREDCDELAAILAGWDGTFSPLIRKRVARHVDGCDICGERRGALVSPLALLGASPIVVAPSALRGRVMSSIRDGAPARPLRLDRDGFPAGIADPRRARTRLGLAAAAVAVVVALVLGLLAGADDDPQEVASVSSSTSTTGLTTSTSAAAITTSTTQGITTSTTVDASGGTTSSTLPIVTPPPTTAPDTDAPVITSVSSQHSMVFATGCSANPKTNRITAEVVGADAVIVRPSLEGEPLAPVTMTRSGDAWIADLGPFDAGTDLTYVVRAADDAGNRVDSAPRSFVITVCPG